MYITQLSFLCLDSFDNYLGLPKLNRLGRNFSLSTLDKAKESYNEGSLWEKVAFKFH